MRGIGKELCRYGLRALRTLILVPMMELCWCPPFISATLAAEKLIITATVLVYYN